MMNWLKKRQYKHPSNIWSPSNQISNKPFRHFRSNMLYPIGSISGRPEAHASNIIQGPCSKEKITLFTAWFCGTREGNLDVAIMFEKISYEPKENLEEIKFQYSSPKIIADLPDRACGNPVLFFAPNNILHLWFAGFYPRGSKESDRLIYHQTSSDLGETWTSPTIFSDRPGLWPRNNLLVLQDGTWLLPLNDEVTMVPQFNTKWSSRFAWSTDQGKTWEFGPLYACNKGMIQPSVVQFNDGKLFSVNRSRNGWIMGMESSNKGKTWTDAKSIGLPNPNSNAIIWKLNDQSLLLVYNPTFIGRTPISLAKSTDKGTTWIPLMNFQTQLGEFSYPCIWETPDGLIHVTYTHRRKTINHDIIQF